jgi:flavin reductase (DIM6/NTAB) family NADH-FMN oxidoreductase RutF
MERSDMHRQSEPGILYFGTPVVLISTVNEDGSYNLAPISSAFWLGWRCLLGFSTSGQSFASFSRTGECVVNLPSVELAPQVDRLALTTGRNPVPEAKQRRGYHFRKDKFGIAGLTPEPSETVAPPRVRECPVQLEGVVEHIHPVGQEDPAQRGRIACVELRIQRVMLAPEILFDGNPSRIDPDKWRPLIMSFQHFYGLGERVHDSRLASIPETLYRGPDIDKARQVQALDRGMSIAV